MRWDEQFAGPVLQVRPAKDADLLHECEDGHSWLEHPNGTVSPGYGLGGTEYTWPDYDPGTCPQPEMLSADGWAPRLKCATCDAKGAPHELFAGLSSSPWEIFEEEKRTGHKHSPPPPACRKPPVSTSRWMEIKTTIHKEVKGGGYKKVIGWTAGWVPVDEAPALEGDRPPEQTSLFDEATRAKAREMVEGSER